MNPDNLAEEDAIKFILNLLKDYLDSNERNTDISDYGMDLYLPKVMRIWMSNYSGRNLFNTSEEAVLFSKISKVFYSSAWELCRRGVLLPGHKSYRATLNSSSHQSNNGYSITPFGEKFINDQSRYILLSTNPTRFAQVIEPYKDRFELGFYQRAMEAIACYNANNFLACCVMCGAAAESIFLNLAIAKVGDEDAVITEYRKSNGRSLIENKIIHDKKTVIIEGIKALVDLLKYWRDEAAHGRQSNISEIEAYLSLNHLLMAARFCHDNYDELIS